MESTLRSTTLAKTAATRSQPALKQATATLVCNQHYFLSAVFEVGACTNAYSFNALGFDDERGDYLIVNHDHLMFRYEILDMLGKGSFGQVAKCYDHKTGEYVAIKIIRNKKRFHCQAVVEVKILNNLNKWVSLRLYMYSCIYK